MEPWIAIVCLRAALDPGTVEPRSSRGPATRGTPAADQELRPGRGVEEARGGPERKGSEINPLGRGRKRNALKDCQAGRRSCESGCRATRPSNRPAGRGLRIGHSTQATSPWVLALILSELGASCRAQVLVARTGIGNTRHADDVYLEGEASRVSVIAGPCNHRMRTARLDKKPFTRHVRCGRRTASLPLTSRQGLVVGLWTGRAVECSPVDRSSA